MKRSVNQIKNIKNQGGWTFWSMIFTMSVIGFFAYVGMQLVPVYNSNSNVKNAMKLSVQNVDIRKVSRSSIIKGIERQLYMDGAHGRIDYKNALKVVRDKNNLTISIKYQSVVPLFANISVLVDFYPTLECSFSGGCEEGRGIVEDK